MLIGWMLNRGSNPEPIAHRRDFPEWDTRLRHAKRTGIHSEEQHTFVAVAVPPQVNLIRGPRVDKRIVNVRDRCGEP